MGAGLRDTVLFGVACNGDFLVAVLQAADFVAGQATTALIADLPIELPALGASDVALGAGLIYRALQARSAAVAGAGTEMLGWGNPGGLNAVLRVSDEDGMYVFRLRETGDDALQVRVAGESHVLTGQGTETRVDGVRADLRAHQYDGARIHVATGRRLFTLTNERVMARTAQATGGGDLRAPMHGVLAQVCVAPGDIVQVGTRLAVLEAMKMQQDLLSEFAGTVRVVPVAAGAQAKAGDLLVEVTVGDAE